MTEDVDTKKMVVFGEISLVVAFSRFLAKSDAFGCVSRAVIAVDSAGELDTVIEGIDREKTSKICEISHVDAIVLVVLIFAFFSIFSECRGL